MNQQDGDRSADRNQRLRVVVFSGMAGFRGHSMEVVSTNILRGLRERRIAVVDVPLRVPNWCKRVRPRMLAEFFLRYIAYPIVAFRCWRKFRERPVYFISDHADAFIACAVPRRAKVVVLVHDLASMMPLRQIPFRKTWRTYLIHLLGILFKKRGVRRADHVVTVSQTIGTEVVKWLNKRPSEITTIYNGFDEQIFHTGDKREAREQIRLNDDFACILSVASSEPRKNIPCLIRAVNELRQDIPNLRLAYIGSLDRASRKLIAELRLETTILRFCNISDGKLALMYRAADVYAFPSDYEGFGLPAIEAMASGLPVVHSNIPTLAEVVAGCGIAFEPNDSHALAHGLKRVIDDKLLAVRLARAGQERARMFHWTTTAEQLAKVFACVQSERCSSPRSKWADIRVFTKFQREPDRRDLVPVGRLEKHHHNN